MFAGKTSLMVKYVEGTFDEVFRMRARQLWNCRRPLVPSGLHSNSRGELYGKESFATQHANNVLNLGFRGPERIHIDAAACVQRERRHVVPV